PLYQPEIPVPGGCNVVNTTVDAGSSSVRIQRVNWRSDASSRHANHTKTGRLVSSLVRPREPFTDYRREERDETREQSAPLSARHFCFGCRCVGTEVSKRSQESVTVGWHGRTGRRTERAIHDLRWRYAEKG